MLIDKKENLRIKIWFEALVQFTGQCAQVVGVIKKVMLFDGEIIIVVPETLD